MTETIITVQGEFSAYYPAERATVNLTVQADGADRARVFAEATEAAETVRASLLALHDQKSGPVTWWSAESIRVWSERPWNQNGDQLPLVYHSSLGFSVKFSAFDTLSEWLESVAVIPGVTVNHVAWDLTDSSRTSATVEVRSRAVKDAVAKASVFAQSIGLGSVTAIALADPGMLGDQGGNGPSPLGSPRMMKAQAFMDSSGGAPLNLTPEEIEIASAVDARFVAR